MKVLIIIALLAQFCSAATIVDGSGDKHKEHPPQQLVQYQQQQQHFQSQQLHPQQQHSQQQHQIQQPQQQQQQHTQQHTQQQQQHNQQQHFQTHFQQPHYEQQQFQQSPPQYIILRADNQHGPHLSGPRDPQVASESHGVGIQYVPADHAQYNPQHVYVQQPQLPPHQHIIVPQYVPQYVSQPQPQVKPPVNSVTMVRVEQSAVVPSVEPNSPQQEVPQVGLVPAVEQPMQYYPQVEHQQPYAPQDQQPQIVSHIIVPIAGQPPYVVNQPPPHLLAYPVNQGRNVEVVGNQYQDVVQQKPVNEGQYVTQSTYNPHHAVPLQSNHQYTVNPASQQADHHHHQQQQLHPTISQLPSQSSSPSSSRTSQQTAN